MVWARASRRRYRRGARAAPRSGCQPGEQGRHSSQLAGSCPCLAGPPSRPDTFEIYLVHHAYFDLWFAHTRLASFCQSAWFGNRSTGWSRLSLARAAALVTRPGGHERRTRPHPGETQIAADPALLSQLRDHREALYWSQWRVWKDPEQRRIPQPATRRGSP